ncbi:hypothetical protein [Actibacterium sp. 188UL27-1]|uniref:hypothetical protein n=1 Tax=Actibacterium sp. 188UL27-1 TaxID=2786961 RepID=UPI00195C1B1E|nr:hypothetical protein [Actibacterium sp. 188UL27-1]MBM7067931.1 hypothetical protein [Actibacterium sp. 188UL27-1]
MDLDLDPDLLFVIGVFSGAAAIPTLLSSFTHGRGVRGAALLFLISAGSFGYAATNSPTGYSVAEAPGIIIRVLSGGIN